VTVSAATSSAGHTAKAWNDYRATAGTLFWGHGETGPRSFTVPIRDDDLIEGDETFQVELFDQTGMYTLGGPAVVTITDNDTGTDTDGDGLADTVDPCVNNMPVDAGGVPYPDLETAYAGFAGPGPVVIKLQGAVDVVGELLFDRAEDVTIRGGYNCDFSGPSGMTTYNGSATMSGGPVTLDNLDFVGIW